MQEKINLDEVLAIVGFMSPARRIQHLLNYLNITKAEIARRHGCSITQVCRTINGQPSLPLQLTIYGFLQDRLGADCPRFELLFDVLRDQEVANG